MRDGVTSNKTTPFLNFLNANISCEVCWFIIAKTLLLKVQGWGWAQDKKKKNYSHLSLPVNSENKNTSAR